ncbi:CRISPR-associated helicase/endonuclease Cas3 [Thomasclavelia cocleata]|uniref:CRISPR-associated helicase, Cas3 family n=1 Tax=Thomasclavelia cocleata TaxID=69824 RepID=A0A1I0EIE4_9FIRM|nr:CRISPR-associated helicase/endonuclease Cas3 [Thomasclavelia cocleata]MCR1959318.1 CRISPR-associated helicase/endonuclease Cas3 [Thomasclavelia cocleata]NDO42345.1 CRISPR-associated helicase/endonuclease Cas3 [Thomasclavelia cocleata]PJN80996.1 CRISPR-associated helicase/endonuclease Cas3 [Thomasclavelia cocleata]SET44915.1 CRISPR-associated helicase, Cas3 family [Thomasclavelia cocleata]
MDIDRYLVSLEKIIINIDQCYGHRDDDYQETINEHIQLCTKYLKEIFKLKKLDSILKSFNISLGEGLLDEGKEMFNELFFNTITFHDTGKINPFFQSEKMANLVINYLNPPKNLESDHSKLSAYIYLGYYLNKLDRFKKSDYKILKTIVYINAFVISRHHSKINDFKTCFIDKFDSDDELEKRIIDWVNDDEFTKLFKDGFSFIPLKQKGRNNLFEKLRKQNIDKQIDIYAYVRFLYSLLVSCDYYATSEFYGDNRNNVMLREADFSEIIELYDNSELVTKIRKNDIGKEKINGLRTKIFLEAERNLIENIDKNIFYLEAPTGSGKSNTALNLSLCLVENNDNLNKIVYVYPFNTLVEQNLASLNKIFGNSKAMNNIVVVNSTIPLKKGEDENFSDEYQKALLDRQFLTYPIILTTHVGLFDTFFGNNRESAFGLCQYANSVIVLDEIQNYRIEIWNEIIIFLKEFAKILNLKIIIMSATLPDLELLTDDRSNSVSLITNPQEYFLNPIFKDRVKTDYSLMHVENTEKALLDHVLEMNKLKKKIMIKFIVRKSAEKFYRQLKEIELDCEVLFISGFDSVLEREKIIGTVKTSKHLILVATQVIEAGVDIDMDIGYKDISKLDSEEQFMGRINRSCKEDGKGIVYFFNLNKATNIYKEDDRVVQKNLTLFNDDMKEVLLEKNFNHYYQKLLMTLANRAKKPEEKNVTNFFRDYVACLDYNAVSKRMELILDTRDRVTIFLGRTVTDINGNEFDGKDIWNRYVGLLKNNEMDYAQKICELSVVKSKMNYFMYQVIKKNQFDFKEQVGDIYYIENGDDYILDGKLNTILFETEDELFI